MADITAVRNVTSGAIATAENNIRAGRATASPFVYGEDDGDSFSSIFDKVLQNINTTNNYLSDAENEEIRWALGETNSTHDLSIALQKAQIALQYTVAVRDRAMAAYREIIQMQI